MNNRIKELLKAKGITGLELSKKLDMSYNTLARIVQNKTFPQRPKTFFKAVSDVLEVPVFRLFELDDLLYGMNASQAAKLNLELSEYTINQLNELNELKHKIEKGNFLLSKIQAEQSLKNMCDNIKLKTNL